ncbi:MAG: LssY C-terminal domain-containing protein, partial [Bradyrhizobium sp.]
MSEMVLRRIWQTTKRWRWQSLALALFFGFALLSWSGDSIPDRNAAQSFTSRAEVRQRGAVSVRAAVLTDDESQRYFGASLADHGIQAIWLSVDNASESQLEFLPIVTDPEYFSEAEVEQLLHMWWRGSANALVKAAVAEAPMPDIIPQRQAATGFVFTHREGGLKLFGVGFETGSEELLFRFALPVRSGSYAIQQVDFTNIYPPGSINDIDLATLREKLAKLPCCTTNKSGTDDGDPLNIVVIGQGLDALFPFIGRGWKLDEPFDLHSAYRTIQAFLFRSEYLNAPVSPLYVFGRQQEVALQKARNTVSLRNHLRLWLAPFTVDRQQVWVGQISRDIGIK